MVIDLVNDITNLQNIFRSYLRTKENSNIKTKTQKSNHLLSVINNQNSNIN